MIKFSHSIFALPFAFTGAILAAQGLPTASQILWITIAMVGARSGAMGLNRLIDKNIDALNPRTANRELPKGVLKSGHVIAFVIGSFAALFVAAWQLNPFCVKLYPVAVAVLFAYSYTKRFTWLSHLVLGVALSLAPLGAWVAIRGTLDWAPAPLLLAVACWVAGFDILYALQDLEFDKKSGLFSIPAIFGVEKSIWIARLLHLATVGLLASLFFIFPLGLPYLIGVFLAAVLLLYEHTLVKANDLSRINVAFFNMNGYISITVFLFTLLSYLMNSEAL